MAKVLYGAVVSDKGDKTIVISVRERRSHPIYKKQYTVNTKFMAHDAKNEAKVGDMVAIVESKPLSARKRFTLDRIIERGGVRFEESDAMAGVEESKPEADTAPKRRTKAAEPATKKEDK